MCLYIDRSLYFLATRLLLFKDHSWLYSPNIGFSSHKGISNSGLHMQLDPADLGHVVRRHPEAEDLAVPRTRGAVTSLLPAYHVNLENETTSYLLNSFPCFDDWITRNVFNNNSNIILVFVMKHSTNAYYVGRFHSLVVMLNKTQDSSNLCALLLMM